MPREMGYDYMGMSYQEQQARQGVPASVIFGFSLLFVFLILAALYESWSLPFSVLLSTQSPYSAPSRCCGCAVLFLALSTRLTWCKSKTMSTRKSGW
jgi:AcrB/AcrD/AcrF family